MKKVLYIITFVFATLTACETYPDWREYVSYSSVYPVCGEYMVKDYDLNDQVITPNYYSLYIYNKSYNPTKDSIWVDNAAGHPATSQNVYPCSFKIKTKADTINLTFNIEKAAPVFGSNPNPVMNTFRVSITNSKIFRLAKDITDPTPDSIYFKFIIYEPDQTTIRYERIVKGHRKTGWEYPNYDDAMN